MYTAEKEEALLAGKPTFVFDAIDNIDTKVSLALLLFQSILESMTTLCVYMRTSHEQP